MIDKGFIEHQKEVSKKVLGLMKPFYPNMLIAGGAPRDWRLGKPAKDVDIYMEYSGCKDSFKNMIQLLGLPQPTDIVPAKDDAGDVSLYGDVEGINHVTEMDYHGVTFQFITLVYAKPMQAVNDFDTSICKYFTRDVDNIEMAHDALVGENNKIIFVKSGLRNLKHFKKMYEMFGKDYLFIEGALTSPHKYENAKKKKEKPNASPLFF